MAAATREHQSVSTLNLAGTALNEADAPWLQTLLLVSTGLVSLNVGHNDLGDNAIHAVAAVIEKSSVLKTVDFSQNKVGDRGGLEIAAALVVTSAPLANLSLSHNCLSETAVRALAVAVVGNSRLQQMILVVKNNNVSDAGKKRLREVGASIRGKIFF